LEYKSKKPSKIIEQIRKYLEAILDGENKDCITLYEELNKQLSKDKGVR